MGGPGRNIKYLLLFSKSTPLAVPYCSLKLSTLEELELALNYWEAFLDPLAKNS